MASLCDVMTSLCDFLMRLYDLRVSPPALQGSGSRYINVKVSTNIVRAECYRLNDNVGKIARRNNGKILNLTGQVLYKS
jgi:hypothetical protein